MLSRDGEELRTLHLVGRGGLTCFDDVVTQDSFTRGGFSFHPLPYTHFGKVKIKQEGLDGKQSKRSFLTERDLLVLK